MLFPGSTVDPTKPTYDPIALLLQLLLKGYTLALMTIR